MPSKAQNKQQSRVIKLIILDRDGVINEDSDNYIKSPAEWVPIDNSIAAIAALKEAGYYVAIATNQSGIARGYYNETTLHAMHKKMEDLLAQQHQKIDYIRYCPHGPDDQCSCRKPKAGMINEILAKFSILPENCLFIGDTISDYRASLAANVHFSLVKTGKGKRTIDTGKLPKNISIYEDLASTVEQIIKQQHEANVG